CTSKDLISKRLAFKMDGTASAFASFSYALPFYIVLLLVLYLLGKESFVLSASFLILVLLRSITDTFAEWMNMYAFSHSDISVVAPFFSLSPIFLLISSPLITQDKLTFTDALAVLLTVAGGLLIVYRPGHSSWRTQKK